MLALAFPITGCARALPVKSPAVSGAPTPPVKSPARSHRPADLTDVRPYRNYLAVTSVGPAGEHFDVWFHDIEPCFRSVFVGQDASGQPLVETERGTWGGLAVAPSSVPSPSGNEAVLARRVLAVLRRQNPNGRKWKIAARGSYRSVTIGELVAHDDRAGATRFGWSASKTIAMDDSLTRLVGNIEYSSGFGMIGMADDAQWISLPHPGIGSHLLLAADIPPELVPAISSAARGYEAAQPPPPIASLIAADAPLLPNGYVAHVSAKVTLIFFGTANSPGILQELGADLDLHDAVSATGAHGEAETIVDGAHYRLVATLVPESPRAPTPSRVNEPYRGTLTVSVENDRGNRWRGAFIASGSIDREGDAVAAPTGFSIPGASWPSAAADARRFTMPGFGRYKSVNGEVSIGLSADPRR